LNLSEGRQSASRKILAVVISAVVISSVSGGVVLYYILSHNSGPPPASENSDYSYFIADNLQRIEALREWFMTPFNLATDKAGYDPSYDMIRGGFWGGGFQDGFVLIDSQLIAASTLDYLNAAAGGNTSIFVNMKQWLAGQFVDPATGGSGTYNGTDRREIMFGTILPCVMSDSGQVYYVPGHTLSDPVPIVTALPTGCMSPAPSAMSTYALWIELSYLDGNGTVAQRMYQTVLNGWTPTPSTGIGGSTGGYFSDLFDSGPDQGSCKSSRALGYFLQMSRATGFWNMTGQSRTVTLQAEDELWAHQTSDGGILVNYPGCGSGTKESPESTGLALLAFDPRLPSWFGRPVLNASAEASMIVSSGSAQKTGSTMMLPQPTGGPIAMASQISPVPWNTQREFVPKSLA
jgi:hypothetical protein